MAILRFAADCSPHERGGGNAVRQPKLMVDKGDDCEHETNSEIRE
jgi:hypothetical protein